jgi:hypothetical protein
VIITENASVTPEGKLVKFSFGEDELVAPEMKVAA